MMALFRYVYDIPYDDLIDEWVLQFHAKVYVVAEKYQIQGLHEKATENMKEYLWNATNWSLLVVEENDATDFIATVRIILTGTPPQDNMLREALVEFAVSHINDLNQVPAFAALLKDHGDFGAEMFAHERLSLNLEGTWMCDGEEDRRAVPRCPKCEEAFDLGELRENRCQKHWTCCYCNQRVSPVCARHPGMPQRVEWNWG
jgi:hypothetical protein